MATRDIESWEPDLKDPEIDRYILDEVGEEGLDMARFIEEKQPISGVDLVEAFPDRKPSAIRKILYALMQARVAEYEKDTDAKGWETFTWALSLNEVKWVLTRRWRDERDNLMTQIRFEQDHEFYACAEGHRRMVFEDAVELQFQCPICGQSMDSYQDTTLLEEMQVRLDELEKLVPA